MTQTRTLDSTTPTTIRSDFAGAGGMVQGIRQAGFTGRVVACEFNEAAVATGRAAGHEYIHGDVRDVPFGSLGSDPIRGEARITPEQLGQLNSGQWYVNLHTARHPGGEIRGQLRPRR